MENQDKEDSKQLFGGASSMRDKTRTTYDSLMRQSKKLGEVATNTVGEMSQSARQMFEQRIKQKQTHIDDIEDLKKVVAHSHEVIAKAKTALPFLFPDEIILDRTKITINKRNFFMSSDVISIRVEDTLNVSVSVGPLFGSVTIASRVMSSIDHFEVEHFWRNDAIRIKQILQGYLIARQNGVNTDHLSCEELAETLYELGPDR